MKNWVENVQTMAFNVASMIFAWFFEQKSCDEILRYDLTFNQHNLQNDPTETYERVIGLINIKSNYFANILGYSVSHNFIAPPDFSGIHVYHRN